MYSDFQNISGSDLFFKWIWCLLDSCMERSLCNHLLLWVGDIFQTLALTVGERFWAISHAQNQHHLNISSVSVSETVQLCLQCWDGTVQDYLQETRTKLIQKLLSQGWSWTLEKSIDIECSYIPHLSKHRKSHYCHSWEMLHLSWKVNFSHQRRYQIPKNCDKWLILTFYRRDKSIWSLWTVTASILRYKGLFHHYRFSQGRWKLWSQHMVFQKKKSTTVQLTIIQSFCNHVGHWTHEVKPSVSTESQDNRENIQDRKIYPGQNLCLEMWSMSIHLRALEKHLPKTSNYLHSFSWACGCALYSTH